MVICKGWILGLNLKKPKPRLAAFCGIITHMLTKERIMNNSDQHYEKFPGFPVYVMSAEEFNQIENDADKPTATKIVAEMDRQYPGWKHNFSFHSPNARLAFTNEL